ncbi:MAG: PEGA domain-containing protein [Planctomycetota bacterium]
MKAAIELLTAALLAVGVALPVRAQEAARDPVGGLYVTTDPPGAAVWVNGTPVGTSPCAASDVPVGSAQVRATMQGRAPANQKVEIERERVRNLHFALQRLQRVGSLAVLTEPAGAEVEVDGRPVGRTPVALRNVKAGTHRVVVRAPEHAARRSAATVLPGEHFVLRGRLQRRDQPEESAASPPSLDFASSLDLSPDDLPEELVLQPVTTLAGERDYAGASQKLDELQKDGVLEAHPWRVVLERKVVAALRELTEAARARLPALVGREVTLSLRTGASLSGTVEEVENGQIRLRTPLGAREVPLSRLSGRQIVRLASHRLDPAEGRSRVLFALLHGADGRFDRARKQLREAAEKGAPVTSAASWIRSRRAWMAAVARARTTAARADIAPTPSRIQRTGPPLSVLVETHHGDTAGPLGALLSNAPFKSGRVGGPFSAEAARGADLLLIRDPGGSVPAFDRREIQHLLDFIRGGGGLVFFGAAHPGEESHPFAPLLRWLGVRISTASLSLSDEAPADYPRGRAVAFPPSGRRHPVTAGSGRVVFPISSPALWSTGGAEPLLRVGQFLSVGKDGARAPPVAVAGRLGRGRFVIFAATPQLKSRQGDAAPVLRNALLWAAATPTD